MTKTEYREYIASEEWRARRGEFLKAYSHCNRCSIPRWLAVVAYDQDLSVHHKSYARIGAELDDDLEPLCRRCHEIETFGVSSLHQLQEAKCTYCDRRTYRLWPCPVCQFCAVMREYSDSFDPPELLAKLYPGTSDDSEIWVELFVSIVEALSWGKSDAGFRDACDFILWMLAGEEKRRNTPRRPGDPPGRVRMFP
jgi:hypothetical protein